MEVREIIQAINDNLKYEEIAFNATIDIVYEGKEPISRVPITFCEPKVKIREHNEYSQVDIIFENPQSYKKGKLERSLEDYENEIVKNREAYVDHTITMMPLFLDGIYVMFTNPMFWVTVADGPANELKCISLLYDNRDISFYKDEEIEKELEKEYNIELD